MEGLEGQVNPTPAATTAPAAAPAPATPAPDFTPSNSGGGNSIKEVFQNMNWTEIIFGVLGSAALFYTIYYYKFNLTMNKSFKTEMQNKIDDLTIKIADIQSAKERDAVTQESLDGFF